MDGKKDRRIKRTKQALHQALMDLILEKRYDKITVQDIIDRADVGRSTFYAHFSDKEDLLVKGFAVFSDDLNDHLQTSEHEGEEEEHVLHSLIFFRHANVQHDLYKAILEGGGADVMLEAGREHLKVDIENHLGKLLPEAVDSNVPMPVITSFLAGAMLSVLVWWLNAERPYSPEEINGMFQQLAMSGVKNLLNAPD